MSRNTMILPESNQHFTVSNLSQSWIKPIDRCAETCFSAADAYFNDVLDQLGADLKGLDEPSLEFHGKRIRLIMACAEACERVATLLKDGEDTTTEGILKELQECVEICTGCAHQLDERTDHKWKWYVLKAQRACLNAIYDLNLLIDFIVEEESYQPVF